MNLVDEQDRLLPEVRRRLAAAATTLRISATLLSTPLRRTNFDCVMAAMIWARVVFPSRAGPKNHRRQPVRLDRAAQKFPRGQDVFLPDKLLQRARPHPAGERCRRVRWSLRLGLTEKVLHSQG